MVKKAIRFTVYIPAEINEQIEFIRFKERRNKNTIILGALKEHLPKQLKKYPDWKELKNE